MSAANFAPLLAEYQRSLLDCQTLYLSAARQCQEECPQLLAGQAGDFPRSLDDLHRGLLVKTYCVIAEADMRWTQDEQRLAQVLFQHVWQRNLGGEELREAVLEMSAQSAGLSWYSLIRPFDRFPPLQARAAELEGLIIRMANLVAKCDGSVLPSEEAALRTIQEELASAFHLLALDRPSSPAPVATPPQHLAQKLDWTGGDKSSSSKSPPAKPAPPIPPDNRTPEQRLTDVLAELEALIGLGNIKEEVRTLTNFLRMQQQRVSLGLPKTDISLHLVFRGNPGTGKTTVARIVGRIYAAMGLLAQGHLVETDRSGMVAEFAGQTSPKTHRKIDEALDGILFIDEAYSLVAESKEDPYGSEAVQALVKRMEDDRIRLAVIAAGYSEPMDDLLATNPGLSSRFGTQFTFPDYTPAELGAIFEAFCEKGHYQIPAATRAKILLGLKYLHDVRDEHFGNGRLARNLFERAIRKLANRIVGIAPLTKELLTRFEPEDIEMADIPAEAFAPLAEASLRFTVTCSGCKNESTIPAEYLGKRVQCKKCSHAFVAAWGQPR